jgi:hypothetical protein
MKRVELQYDDKLVEQVDKAWKSTGGVITSRAHYFKLAVLEKMKRDSQSPAGVDNV